MKKIFFQCLLIAIISSNLPAYSELVNISVGPQYTNKVWYDLTSQTQTTRGRDGFETEGDFGWGSYDMNTLAIVGDKLYIYRSVEGKYYIFTIQDLISGTYTFKYRLLNSSNAITREFAKSSATSKLFGYYSISADEFLDLEPLQSDWHLLFSKYIAMIKDDSGNTLPYSVMGVLTNYQLPVVKVENIPNNLTSGMYIVSLNINGHISAQKLIVKR